MNKSRIVIGTIILLIGIALMVFETKMIMAPMLIGFGFSFGALGFLNEKKLEVDIEIGEDVDNGNDNRFEEI